MPRAPLPCLAFALTLAACEAPCADGFGRAADGACYPICATGTPSTDDSGGVVDSDPQGGADDAFTIDVRESGSLARDTCVGQFTVQVNEQVDPPVTGTFSCAFNGDLSYLPGASGTFTGGVTLDGLAAGDLYGDNWLQGPWTGNYVDGALTGEFQGQAVLDGYTLEYLGQFGSPEPPE
ncbi:MAG: hypothetical protein H6740_12255 [Alphaproteobacteria bacterium]|nr:hypothetical protein [Alphaproteobacteria bacterium]